MKKVSVGSWAYIMGEYGDKPMMLPELCAGLNDLGFDGISMGGFKPHANPELYDTDEKRAGLKKLLADNGLEVADYAVDTWSVDSLKQTDEWMAFYTAGVEFMAKMGWDTIRIDSGTPPVLPEGMTYAQAKDKIIAMFSKCAAIAAKEGINVVWEFEPGFMINEPKNVVQTVKDVNEKNFSMLLDTCHAHMSAVIGSRHIEEGCKLSGGIVEFITMAKDMIGHVHVIDSDGTLNVADTSTHNPFGTGAIDFDVVIPALLDIGNYKGDWWSIDLCEWPDAWKVTADSKAFMDQINEKYCK
jgi:sugar phosphate isomerase/epimerase